MTLLRFLLLVLAVSGGAVLIAPLLRRRREAKLLSALRAGWGQIRNQDRNLSAIATYHAFLAASGRPSLDDRTWADLNMDELFTVLDRTSSSVGQQLLYARLRSQPDETNLAAFDALVTRLTTDQAAREAAHVALVRLRDPSAYDLFRLTEPDALTLQPWYAIFPVLTVVMVASFIGFFFAPPLLLVLIAGSVVSVSMRATLARRLAIVSGAFRQVAPLVRAAQASQPLATAETQPILGTIAGDVSAVGRLRRVATWVSRDAGGAMAGELTTIVLEYLNLLLFLDANALFFGARELKAHSLELLRLIDAVGTVDAALAVASYRAGTTGWTRPSLDAKTTDVVMRGIRHPLLPDAVPNTAIVGDVRGLIITGSNMSGKTTFLRTAGVTAVMAQTIHTCVADEWRAPPLVVRSCIGLADDPASGKSYYMVEVDSVVALVRSSQRAEPHLFLFDELFRGTNAVERIAGGEAVLRALLGPHANVPSSHVVIAATHDQELVDLLDPIYAAFHFTDAVDESGLSFDYRLTPGRAEKRNALALLRLRGAPASLVDHAIARAAELDRIRRTIQ